MSPPRFRGRAFVALLTTFSFVVLVVTGVVLYVEPHGRVAYWTDWRLLGLGKQHWDGVHIVGATLFLVAAGVHTYLNWRPLVRYLAGKTRDGARQTRELSAALSVVLLCAVGAAAGWQPFQAVLDLNEHAKASWARKPGEQPPFGHAELASVASLCREEGGGPGPRMAGARRGGGHRRGARLAESPTARQVFRRYAGSGLGRRTIGGLCAELGLDAERGVSILASHGIPASAGRTVRSVALAASKRPSELLAALCESGECR